MKVRWQGGCGVDGSTSKEEGGTQPTGVISVNSDSHRSLRLVGAAMLQASIADPSEGLVGVL